MTLASIVALLLLADDVRLRIKHHRPKSINVLGNGLMLPDPNDERWTKHAKPGRQTSYCLGKVCAIFAEAGSCSYPDSLVAVAHYAVLLDGRNVDSWGIRRYVKAVRFAYDQRLALKSMEDPT